MVGTYASVLAVCVASLALGHGLLSLGGSRGWSWLSPAVGLAALCIVCWATVRLPGGGRTAAVAVAILAIAATVLARRESSGSKSAAAAGAPVALTALLAASLPFIVEGRFGILGTSFNPDMSQHLLTAARLSAGDGSQLLAQGYPLGPHSIVVALHDGLGIGLVQGFSGLTIAVAVLAALTALSAFADLAPVRRVTCCLLVALPYMVASYFAQGAFKEAIEALFVLAFVLGLREVSRGRAGESTIPGSDPRFRAVPLAVIAAGSVYAYSFPGLFWLGGAALLWGLLELVWAGTTLRPGRARATTAPLGFALAAFLLVTLPEVGRMVAFRNFETFDPAGAGLGNLFGQISPLEALGIWPSGDFRLTPGDGAVPAVGYYLGIALALLLLLHGIAWCWRRRESAVLAGLGAALAIYVLARATGTPYQAAKAVELIAPLAALAIVLPLALGEEEARDEVAARDVGRGSPPGRSARLRAPAAGIFATVALGCSVLVLVNAPVGPTGYSPRLTELRPLIGAKPTLILALGSFLDDEHGRPYLAWELRGTRLCIAAEEPRQRQLQRGIGYVITTAGSGPPYPGLRRVRGADPYVLWAVRRPARASSPCPLIAVRAARRGS